LGFYKDIPKNQIWVKFQEDLTQRGKKYIGEFAPTNKIFHHGSTVMGLPKSKQC